MNRPGHFSIQCSIFLACLAGYFFKYPCKMLRVLKSQLQALTSQLIPVTEHVSKIHNAIYMH